MMYVATAQLAIKQFLYLPFCILKLVPFYLLTFF